MSKYDYAIWMLETRLSWKKAVLPKGKMATEAGRKFKAEEELRITQLESAIERLKEKP